MYDNRKDAIAGSLSGFSVRALTQPLDVLKIRFQVRILSFVIGVLVKLWTLRDLSFSFRSKVFLIETADTTKACLKLFKELLRRRACVLFGRDI